jgi:hypothetical protein
MFGRALPAQTSPTIPATAYLLILLKKRTPRRAKSAEVFVFDISTPFGRENMDKYPGIKSLVPYRIHR